MGSCMLVQGGGVSGANIVEIVRFVMLIQGCVPARYTLLITFSCEMK